MLSDIQIQPIAIYLTVIASICYAVEIGYWVMKDIKLRKLNK